MISAYEANALATARINRDLARMVARVEAVPVQGRGEPPSSLGTSVGSPKALDRESHT